MSIIQTNELKYALSWKNLVHVYNINNVTQLGVVLCRQVRLNGKRIVSHAEHVLSISAIQLRRWNPVSNGFDRVTAIDGVRNPSFVFVRAFE